MLRPVLWESKCSSVVSEVFILALSFVIHWRSGGRVVVKPTKVDFANHTTFLKLVTLCMALIKSLFVNLTSILFM